MVKFTATIVRYQLQGEKTGWTLIEIPPDIASQIKPAHGKSFPVKGYLDAYQFSQVSLLPVGQGKYIMPLNASVRKMIRKTKGAVVAVRMEPDTTPYTVPSWMIECLEDEPKAQEYFNKLLPSHQKYFIKWIESAKTEPTRVKRIAQAVTAFSRQMDFGEMVRWNRDNNDLLP